ncbi:MAG TPA: hypothetical protein DEV59_01855 [Proteus sp.]|nr:hypothetical protein [Proteus sp. (in: enterobacteria)]
MIKAEFTEESRNDSIKYLENKINKCIAKLYMLTQSDPETKEQIVLIEKCLNEAKKRLDIIKNK